MSIADTAYKRLQAVRGQWHDIAKETGLGYSWLTKFGQGKIPNPQVRRVELLLSHPLMSGDDKAA